MRIIKTFEGFADSFKKNMEYSVANSIIEQIDSSEFLSDTHKMMLRNQLLKDIDDFDFTKEEIIIIKDIESGNVFDDLNFSDEFLNKMMKFQDRVQKSIESLKIKFKDPYAIEDLLNANDDW